MYRVPVSHGGLRWRGTKGLTRSVWIRSHSRRSLFFYFNYNYLRNNMWPHTRYYMGLTRTYDLTYIKFYIFLLHVLYDLNI